MPLSAGEKFGPYEVVSPLGAGGMGEVYRARDSRLGRDVALKILPAEVTNDASRRARFEQEARASAALQHAGIVAVFDVGEQDGVAYMVTELIEGETLRSLLAGGALSPRKATDLGAQIADALAAAHAAGISHRDLKPENVMVTREGKAKILDFGLAKFAPQSSTEATLTAVGTEPGVVMGTVGYMAPEQARGLAVDHRADIFSFGSVFYELLSGKKAFQRGSAIETLNAIIKEEVAPLPAEVPSGLWPIVNHCMEKEPVARFQSAKDLAFALRSSGGSTVVSGSVTAGLAPKRQISWAWLALPLAVALGFWGRGIWAPADPEGGLYSVRPLTSMQGDEEAPALSPNGQQLAFFRRAGKGSGIFVQLVNGTGQTLRLTEYGAFPVWSQDGSRIYFVRGSRASREVQSLWTMSALGGGERRIFEFPVGVGLAGGLGISADGRWLIGLGRGKVSGLLQVPVDGGAMRELTKPPAGERDSSPAFTQDGRRIAFTRTSAYGTRRLLVADLNAEGMIQGETRSLDEGNWDIRGIAWTADGRWLVAGTLDGARERIVKFPADGGTAVRLALELPRDDQTDRGIREISLVGSRLAITLPSGHFTISKWSAAKPDGTLSVVPFEASSRSDDNPDLSPDGKWVAFSSTRSGATEIWRANADGEEALQLTTFGGVMVRNPKISPDGRSIAFTAEQKGLVELWTVSSDGGRPQLVYRNIGESRGRGPAWSPDSRSIFDLDRSASRPSILRIPREGGKAQRIGPEGAIAPVVSSDGKWLYFRMDQEWKRMPIAGGEASTVGNYPGDAELGGNKFYFSRRETDNNVLLFIEADPEKKTERVILRQPLDQPAERIVYVSPDGKTVFTTSLRNAGSDILLVEGVR